jgi:glycosyltransferase 2 family protein
MKRLILLGISLGILVVLWSKTGWSDLWRSIKSLDPIWFGLALLMAVPQTAISALRWSWIVSAFQPLKFSRATELVLASSSLNVVLPSKMGDVLKGAFLMKDRPGGDLVTGVSLGLFEKVTDTASLATVMMIASIFSPPEEPLGVLLILCGLAGTIAFVLLMSRWGASRLARFSNVGKLTIAGRLLSVLGRIGAIIEVFQKDRVRLFKILGISLVLWVLHLAQFSFVYLATAPEGHHYTGLLWSRIPMAIFIGLIPISFAGVGTRDAAMVYLLGRTPIGEDAAVLLGAFATFRYVVVALAGLPFVWRLPSRRMLPTKESDFTTPPDLSRRRPTPVPTGRHGPSR